MLEHQISWKVLKIFDKNFLMIIATDHHNVGLTWTYFIARSNLGCLMENVEDFGGKFHKYSLINEYMNIVFQ